MQQRVRVLIKLHALLNEHKDEIAHAIVRYDSRSNACMNMPSLVRRFEGTYAMNVQRYTYIQLLAVLKGEKDEIVYAQLRSIVRMHTHSFLSPSIHEQ